MSEHTAEEMKGRLKEAAGDITGNKELQREGKIDQTAAAAKRQIDNASDKIKEVTSHKK